ncbi:sugar transferase [[Clostridium] leptum]|nr:sugar transferase [[Clostridium] leptum]
MYRIVKRCLDFALAFFLVLLTLVPMGILYVLIRLESSGSPIFVQNRTGLYGKVFHMYKFRSMVASNDIYDFKQENKYTKLGKILRKTSLDELPQLFNVLKGDMSFIGPRPWIPDYYERFNEEQKHRVDVLPGITGLAQCKGRNNIPVQEKISYDLEYVDHLSFGMDLKVFFLTMKALFTKEGADLPKSGIHEELVALERQNRKETGEDLIAV